MSRLRLLYRTLPPLAAAGLLTLSALPPGASAPPPPYAPADALATFEIADGFRIEPFAAEPLVRDPVAMEIDEDGRLFVVEMPGYPLDVGGSGRVMQLHDTDADGRPDSASVFAGGLTLPTGLMRWKGGLLVTDAPDVLYLEDTTGDGRADVRRAVLTGFARSNPQHNFNAPRFGLDGWIYLANSGTAWWTEKFGDIFGGRGEAIRFPGAPDAPTLGTNGYDRNVRFHPDTHTLETMSGWTQFGHTFDAFGRHFLVNNDRHLFHEMLAWRYQTRNPDLPIRSALADTPDHGAAAEVYPITLGPQHQLLTDRGVFTSACGIAAYLGGAFPTPFERAVFVAEPVHNLVHVDLIAPDGASFTARRHREGREFLASEDAWFRPVGFYTGPDGALYVLDYYRRIVEHPEWMDDTVAATEDLYEGSDRGRIYRIVPDGAGEPGWLGRPQLPADPAGLTRALEDANGWRRLHAQRLLLDRGGTDAVPLLTEIARAGATPEARVHALHTLNRLDALTASVLTEALQDAAPGVREHAVLLAEPRLEEDAALAGALPPLADDPSPRVRYQLLLTLGGRTTPEARAVRQRLLFAHVEDPWMQLAALTAQDLRAADVLDGAIAALAGQETDGGRLLFERLGHLAGASGGEATIRRLLRAAEGPAGWWQAPALGGLAEGIRGRPSLLRPHRETLADRFFATGDAALRSALLGLLATGPLPDGAAARAARRAADGTHDAARRADAVRLLALAPGDAPDGLFATLIDAAEPMPVQEAALDALGRLPGAAPARHLLGAWPTLSPTLRTRAVDVFMADEARMALLLDAVEAGTVLPATIGWQRRVVLMRDTDAPVRDRARRLLYVTDDPEATSAGALDDALTLPGEARRGAEVFAQRCAACHRAGPTAGTDFGPDLATVRHWPRAHLIAAVQDPARSIADGYEQWQVLRKSGGAVTGILDGETANALTLRTLAGTVTVPRADLAAIEPAPGSAMPAGLLGGLDAQGVADLLAFLRDE